MGRFFYDTINWPRIQQLAYVRTVAWENARAHYPNKRGWWELSDKVQQYWLTRARYWISIWEQAERMK